MSDQVPRLNRPVDHVGLPSRGPRVRFRDAVGHGQCAHRFSLARRGCRTVSPPCLPHPPRCDLPDKPGRPLGLEFGDELAGVVDRVQILRAGGHRSRSSRKVARSAGASGASTCSSACRRHCCVRSQAAGQGRVVTSACCADRRGPGFAPPGRPVRDHRPGRSSRSCRCRAVAPEPLAAGEVLGGGRQDLVAAVSAGQVIHQRRRRAR